MRVYSIFTYLLILFFVAGIKSQSLYNGVGHIPYSCSIEWANAGLINPIINADRVLNITDPKYTGNWNQKVDQAITETNGLPGISIILFPAGTYTFDSTIMLASNIVLQGEGQDATNFIFTIPKCDNCIEIFGGSYSNEVVISNDILKRDKVIDVTTTTGYQTGSWIQYRELYNPETYYYDPRTQEASYTTLGQISKVTSVDVNSSIYVEDEASKEYEVSNTLLLRKLYPIENVGIENISINRVQTGIDDGKGFGITIFISRAVNCWIKGVETYMATGYHMAIRESAHIEVSGCYICSASEPFGILSLI